MPDSAESLHGFACAACLASYPHGAERVTLRCSWRLSWERVCRQCWVEIMTRAAVVLGVQGELPLDRGDRRN